MFTAPYHTWPRAAYDQLLRDVRSHEALSTLPRRHPITIVSPWAEGEPGSPNALPYTGTHGVFRIHIGPKPLHKQHAQVELAALEHDAPLDVRLNGIPCGAVQRQRHVYDVPSEAVGDGYNLIEVIAKRNVSLSWVEISVQ